jgi:hypothetical protein
MNVDSSLSASYPQAISDAQIDPALVLRHSPTRICNGRHRRRSPFRELKERTNQAKALHPTTPENPVGPMCPHLLAPSDTSDADCEADAAPTIRDRFAQLLQT